MERIFESLAENVSEACFEDIIGIVEEYIHELKAASPKNKEAALNRRLKDYKSARTKFEKTIKDEETAEKKHGNAVEQKFNAFNDFQNKSWEKSPNTSPKHGDRTVLTDGQKQAINQAKGIIKAESAYNKSIPTENKTSQEYVDAFNQSNNAGGAVKRAKRKLDNVVRLIKASGKVRTDKDVFI